MHIASGGHEATHRHERVAASHAWPAGQRRPTPQAAPTPHGCSIVTPHATASLDGALVQVSVQAQRPAVQVSAPAHARPQAPQLAR